MANPQKEDGYTPIANELLERIYKLKLNGTQFKIIMCVWRYTYGFSRVECEISESFIAKAIETHVKQVSRELTVLIKMNIITVVRPATFKTSRKICLNKNYDNWLLDNINTTDSLPPKESERTTPSESIALPVSESVTQDKQYIKTNIKQYIPPSNPPKKIKHKYGEYGHVLLTDSEKEKLISDLGQDMFEKCIIRLDEYIEMKGYKAKNHNLAIRRWVVNAVKEDERKQKGESYENSSNWYEGVDYYRQFTE